MAGQVYRGRGRGEVAQGLIRDIDLYFMNAVLMEEVEVGQRNRHLSLQEEDQLRNEITAMRLGIPTDPLSLSPYMRRVVDINRVHALPLRTPRPPVNRYPISRGGLNQRQSRGRYGMTVTDIRRHQLHNCSPELSHNFERVAAGLDLPLSSRPCRVMDVIPLLEEMAQAEANRNRAEQDNDDIDYKRHPDHDNADFPRYSYPVLKL